MLLSLKLTWLAVNFLSTQTGPFFLGHPQSEILFLWWWWEGVLSVVVVCGGGGGGKEVSFVFLWCVFARGRS